MIYKKSTKPPKPFEHLGYSIPMASSFNDEKPNDQRLALEVLGNWLLTKVSDEDKNTLNLTTLYYRAFSEQNGNYIQIWFKTV